MGDRRGSSAGEGQVVRSTDAHRGARPPDRLDHQDLRFYEQAGLLPEPERQPSGYRDYDESALARLRFVRAAQAAGLTLAEIRQVIDVRDQTGPPCQHVTQLLDAHAADLDRRLAELTALRDEVRRLRDRADGLDPGSCDPVTICHVTPAPTALHAPATTRDHS